MDAPIGDFLISVPSVRASFGPFRPLARAVKAAYSDFTFGGMFAQLPFFFTSSYFSGEKRCVRTVKKLCFEEKKLALKKFFSKKLSEKKYLGSEKKIDLVFGN